MIFVLLSDLNTVGLKNRCQSLEVNYFISSPLHSNLLGILSVRIAVRKVYRYYALSYPLFWLSGLYLIFFIPYFLWFLRSAAVRRNALTDGFLIFFLYQFVSLVIGFFWNSEFEYSRAPNILHNMAVFLLIPAGYLMCARQELPQLMLNFSRRLLVFFFLVSCLVFIYTYSTKDALVLAYPWTDVYLSRVGFIGEITIPRVSLFAPYVNGTAILSFLAYSIYLHKLDESRGLRLLFGLLALFIALFAGSRIVVFSIAILIFLSFVRNRLALMVAFISLPIFVYLSLEMNFWSVVQSARSGSSETRLWIYQVGLALMYEVNFLTGLGVKPFIDVIPDYPVGSHSTFIGYVIKHGLLSLIFLFLWFLFVVKVAADKISKFIFRKIGSISAIATMPVALLVFVFEDIDAYELNALLFGFLLYFWLREDSLNEKSA